MVFHGYSEQPEVTAKTPKPFVVVNVTSRRYGQWRIQDTLGPSLSVQTVLAKSLSSYKVSQRASERPATQGEMDGILELLPRCLKVCEYPPCFHPICASYSSSYVFFDQPPICFSLSKELSLCFIFKRKHPLGPLGNSFKRTRTGVAPLFGSPDFGTIDRYLFPSACRPLANHSTPLARPQKHFCSQANNNL